MTELTITDPDAVVARFTIPGEPVSKARARFTKRGSTVMPYTPEKTRVAEESVAWHFRAAGGRLVEDADVTFGVIATFHSGTRQRRDVDNMLKLVLDGLNGIAWMDDNQVFEIAGSKRYVGKTGTPRTDVTVYRVGAIERDRQACLYCGKEFITYDSWKNNPNGKKYCSPECAYAHRRERRERTCANCGATFYAHGQSRSTKFCSRECSNASGRIEIPCKICGTVFWQYRSWAESRPYCSSDCVAENKRRRARERRTKTFPGKCLICGAGTTRKEYQRCNACKRAGKDDPERAASGSRASAAVEGGAS